MMLAVDGRHLRVEHNMYVGQRLQFVDQIAGHGAKRVAPHEHAHIAGVLGEVHCRLPGRVRAADDEGVLPLDRQGLEQGAAIVDAGPDQLLDAGHVQFAVGNAAAD